MNDLRVNNILHSTNLWFQYMVLYFLIRLWRIDNLYNMALKITRSGSDTGYDFIHHTKNKKEFYNTKEIMIHRDNLWES